MTNRIKDYLDDDAVEWVPAAFPWREVGRIVAAAIMGLVVVACVAAAARIGWGIK